MFTMVQGLVGILFSSHCEVLPWIVTVCYSKCQIISVYPNSRRMPSVVTWSEMSS